MAKARKKQLPKDFETLLDTDDTEVLKLVFVTCDVNARGGDSKQTASVRMNWRVGWWIKTRISRQKISMAVRPCMPATLISNLRTRWGPEPLIPARPAFRSGGGNGEARIF
jgi:hypothetical protein